jgi:hypothetical protein
VLASSYVNEHSLSLRAAATKMQLQVWTSVLNHACHRLKKGYFTEKETEARGQLMLAGSSN